jgi:putative intracellular protease/amidase
MRYSTFSVLFAAAAIAAVPEKPSMTNTTATPKHFAMLVFPGFQAIDVFGPLDVLNTLSMIYDPTMHVSIISATLDPVSTLPSPNQNMTMKHGDFGQCIVPTDTYKNVLGNDGKCGGSGEMSHMHAKRHEGHDHAAAPVASAVAGYSAAPMPSMSTVYGSAPAHASSATPIKYDTGAYSVSPVQYDTGAYSAAPVPYDTGAYSAAPLPSAAPASSAASALSEAHDMLMPTGSHAMMPVASMMPSMAMSEKGDIDVLMIPGGSGTRGLMEEEIAFVKSMYPKVCFAIPFLHIFTANMAVLGQTCHYCLHRCNHRRSRRYSRRPQSHD